MVQECTLKCPSPWVPHGAPPTFPESPLFPEDISQSPNSVPLKWGSGVSQCPHLKDGADDSAPGRLELHSHIGWRCLL